MGAAGALYIAIAQYGSFRSGVDFLATDAKRLAECITSEVLFLTQTRHENTVHIEARIGIVESLKGIIDTAELARKGMSSSTVKSTMQRLIKIQEEAHHLLANLKDPKDVQYVGEQLCELLRDILPIKLPDSPKRRPDTEEQTAYAAIRRKILDELESHGKRNVPTPKKKKRSRMGKK